MTIDLVDQIIIHELYKYEWDESGLLDTNND